MKKGQNSTKKARNLLVHIVELSTALVKVVIKVINASLTQNQCLQCFTPPLMHVEIPRPCDATELNNDGTIKLGEVYYQQNWFVIFSKDLINDNSSFCSHSHILFAIDLQRYVFPFEKLFFNVRLCQIWRHLRQIWRHLHATMLQCWAKFSDVLISWCIRMIRAKNYKTVSKFVKVIPRMLWPLFSQTRVYMSDINWCNTERLRNANKLGYTIP